MDWEDEGDVCGNLTLIGVVGIEDPVRPEGKHRNTINILKNNSLQLTKDENPNV